MFTAKTCATIKAVAGDSYEYCSDKEYENIHAQATWHDTGKIKSASLKVGKSGTPAESTAAAAELGLESIRLLREQLQLMSKTGGK